MTTVLNIKAKKREETTIKWNYNKQFNPLNHHIEIIGIIIIKMNNNKEEISGNHHKIILI